MSPHELTESLSTKVIVADLSRAAPGGLLTVEDAAETLRTTQRLAAVRLASLARRGWLTRVKRGVYYILPLEASGAEGVVAPDPWVLADRLFAPCYVGGWSAAEHWGLTEQLFRSTFVVTGATIRSRSPRVLGTEFRLVRLPPERVAGVGTVWRGPVRVAVSDRERTIADALIDPTWVGGIRHLVDILQEYADDSTRDFSKVLEYLKRLERRAGIKRFGFLLERLYPSESALIAEANELRSAGIIRLDPSIRSRGRLVKRWGLWVNASIGAREGAAEPAFIPTR